MFKNRALYVEMVKKNPGSPEMMRPREDQRSTQGSSQQHHKQRHHCHGCRIRPVHSLTDRDQEGHQVDSVT
jgi:hypothetical protein